MLRRWPKAGELVTTILKTLPGCSLLIGIGSSRSHRNRAEGLPMREAIGDRELIILDGLGVRLQGTYHHPADRQSGAPAEPANLNRIGILFVNSLSMPRAASGDSAVRWAESIADQGYPSFRIDLPGLGDSEGEASTDLLDIVNAGGFAYVAAAAANQLVKRFGLSGVVFFGHCAGAVSALYAGVACSD